MRAVAHIRSEFPEKFGIPRQAGLVEELRATVVFDPEYRDPEALRGLQGFSHIWLIWEFSKTVRDTWSPTVRPPRLGGNTRVGVFATRSPFRPNPVGLSCVKLLELRDTQEEGTVLLVAGADLMDGTPIYDIKPYVPYTDCHPEASGGFTDTINPYLLQVEDPGGCLESIPLEHRSALIGVLAHDPRPSYQNDPERIYGMSFAGFNIQFQVRDDMMTIIDVHPNG